MAEAAPRFGSLWTLLLAAMTLEQPLEAWKARDPQGYALARKQARTITANPALVYAAAVELGFAAAEPREPAAVETHDEPAAVEAHDEPAPFAAAEPREPAAVEAHDEPAPFAAAEPREPAAVEAHDEPAAVELHGKRRAKKAITGHAEKPTKRTASDIEGLQTGLRKALTQHGSQHALAQALSWSQSTISKFLGGKPISEEKREDLAAFLNEKRL